VLAALQVKKDVIQPYDRRTSHTEVREEEGNSREQGSGLKFRSGIHRNRFCSQPRVKQHEIKMSVAGTKEGEPQLTDWSASGATS
jgi:hypothetical protein